MSSLWKVPGDSMVREEMGGWREGDRRKEREGEREGERKGGTERRSKGREGMEGDKGGRGGRKRKEGWKRERGIGEGERDRVGRGRME